MHIMSPAQQALSPLTIEGTHDSLGRLPDSAVEVVHRVGTDPGRLGEHWYHELIARAVTAEQYVEIGSVAAHTVAIDTMARGLGIDPLPMPNPEPVRPRIIGRRSPGRAARGSPWIEPEDAGEVEAGVYPSDRHRRTL
jgi:hypothetical protein